ncbi:MAG: peptidase S41, partial [Roseibium sp.]
ALPDELKGRAETKGEAGLRGHLEAEGEEGEKEQSGSQAYVPADPDEDTQLKLALDLLRGEQVNSAFPPTGDSASAPN